MLIQKRLRIEGIKFIGDLTDITTGMKLERTERAFKSLRALFTSSTSSSSTYYFEKSFELVNC